MSHFLRKETRGQEAKEKTNSWTGSQQISQAGDPAEKLRTPRDSDFEGRWDLITELPQDWGNLEGTNKTLCTPRARRKDSVSTRDWARLACEGLRVSGEGAGWQWPASGSGSLTAAILGGAACWHKSFWKRSPLLLPLFGLRPNYREETQPHSSAENWVKDLLSMALPTRAKSRSSHSESLPAGGVHKPLILVHQRAVKMRTTITEN